MKSPIEMMMDGVEWVENPEAEGHPMEGIYATHSGVLEIMDTSLRVYRLNTGQTVIHAEDVEGLFK